MAIRSLSYGDGVTNENVIICIFHLYNESEQSKKQVGKNSCVSKKETFIYSRSLQNLEFSNFDVVFCKG